MSHLHPAFCGAVYLHFVGQIAVKCTNFENRKLKPRDIFHGALQEKLSIIWIDILVRTNGHQVIFPIYDIVLRIFRISGPAFCGADDLHSVGIIEFHMDFH